MGAVERAIKIALLRPLHVVGDDQIEFAVAVIVDPGGAGREFVRPPQSRRLGHVGESAVAVVVEEMALTERGDVEVVEAVVVVIADRDAEAEHRERRVPPCE